MLSSSAIARRLGIPLPPTIDSSAIFSDLTEDSRQVVPGAIFFAIPGAASDGHRFVDEAFARGAAACVVTDAGALKGRPGFIVPETQIAFSKISALAYGDPSSKLSVIAITGTNGKTTTNWIFFHLLNQCGFKTSRLGTLGSQIPGCQPENGLLTTPGAKAVQSFLAGSVKHGCQAAVIEASSHALKQHRIDAVKCDVGVFTNLTRDHLDYHKNFEDYFAAKCELSKILQLSNGKRRAIINSDDPYGVKVTAFARELSLPVSTFGFSERAEHCITGFEQASGRASFSVKIEPQPLKFTIPFIGRHNAYNFTGALVAALEFGIEAPALQSAAGRLPQVPGRLEAIAMDGVTAYIDYAHTPDALERALQSLRPITAGKLWVLFGCGGDRDRGKRPQMAEVAFRLADTVAVTSDNPRTEDPEAIIKEVLSGGGSPAVCEADRRQAIASTLGQTRAGDAVLLAGKGHEDYQIIGHNKLPFSDAEEVRKFFSKE